MDYEIVSADPELGNIVVKFAHEGMDDSMAMIEVPIEDGVFLSGDALEQKIQSHAPVWLLERRAAVAAATGFEAIAALVTAQGQGPGPEQPGAT